MPNKIQQRLLSCQAVKDPADTASSLKFFSSPDRQTIIKKLRKALCKSHTSMHVHILLHVCLYTHPHTHTHHTTHLSCSKAAPASCWWPRQELLTPVPDSDCPVGLWHPALPVQHPLHQQPAANIFSVTEIKFVKKKYKKYTGLTLQSHRFILTR